MISASGPLLTLLNSTTQYHMADLYELSLAGAGVSLRLTDYDTDLHWNGNAYTSIPMEGGRIRITTGVSVDKMSLTLSPPSTVLVNGRTLVQAAVLGELDGAQITRRRIFMPTPGDTSITPLVRFVGRVAEVRINRMRVSLESNADFELLNMQMPRDIYQAKCIHTLFDSGCALVKATFAITSTVTSGTTQSAINCGLGQATGYFDLGTVEFTSGALSGTKRSVKSYTTGQFVLIRPLPSIPANGDGFTAHPGCDKLKATCTTKFSNLANFRGYPYIPLPEAAY